jgi:hypothetical protein
MPTLYTLLLSKPIKGFGKPSVNAIPAMTAGDLCPVTRELVRPNPNGVREALPHYYRKAFDRNGGTGWFNAREAFKGCYFTLTDTRGKYLNTVYAVPYVFGEK